MIPAQGWTLEMAQGFIRNVSGIFGEAGYIVGIYGSVLFNGEGRDLDLIVAPKRHRNERTDPEDLIRRLQSISQGMLSDKYTGLLGNEAWTLTLRDQRVIDVSFRIKDYDYLGDSGIARFERTG